MDKKLLFGSEIYGDDTNDNLGIFQTNGLTRDHVNHIIKTFALDLFIYNTDRHVNQFKIFKQNRDNRIISFDFGDSLFRYWPNMDLPMHPSSNTMINIRFILKQYRAAVDWGVAEIVLQRLEAIEGADMVATMKTLPKGWLDRRVADAFTKWFGGRLRRDRVVQIREGLRDGTYL